MTRRQKQLLGYLELQITATGVAPSFDEMKAHLGLKSKSNIFRLLNSLEERGFIRRHHYRARAIEILYPDTGPDLQTAFRQLKQTISPYFIRGVDLRNAAQVQEVGMAFREFERLIVGDILPALPASDDPLMLAHQFQLAASR